MAQKSVGSFSKNCLLPFRKRNYPISIKIVFFFTFRLHFCAERISFLAAIFVFYRYAVSCPQVRKISRNFHSCINACDWSLILWKNSRRKKQHPRHTPRCQGKKKTSGIAIVTLVLLSRSTRCRWAVEHLVFFCVFVAVHSFHLRGHLHWARDAAT